MWGRLRRSRESDGGPRITMVERDGCHLCDQAAAVVESVAQRTGVRWHRVDIDSSPELLEQYADLVPVILVDGREVAHWTVDEATLTRALRRRPWAGRRPRRAD